MCAHRLSNAVQPIKTAMTHPVYLRKNVKFCHVDGSAIFLDIPNDKYQYINSKQAEALQKLGKTGGEDGRLTPSKASFDILSGLVSEGLLTYNSDCGVEIKPTSHPSPTASVYDNYWERTLHPTVTLNLLIAHWSARRDVTSKSFSKLLETATRKKLATKRSTPSSPKKDGVLESAQQIVDSRSFLYSSFDKCYLDSYTFFLYFINKGISVYWVFGVDLFPFKAHCWIEYQGVVLNDSLERTLAFTPIHII